MVRLWKDAQRWREAQRAQIQERDKARRLYGKMEQMGLLKSVYGGDPTEHIGTALILAREYGIELWCGTSHSEARAVLPREKWISEPDPDVSPWDYGAFLNTPPESIYAFHRCPQVAICRCLINAKIAGVL